jgi:hypothetical protein
VERENEKLPSDERQYFASNPHAGQEVVRGREIQNYGEGGDSIVLL